MKKPAKKKVAKKAASKTAAPKEKVELRDGMLTGWPMIAAYLGQPQAFAQRRAKEGMPVEKKGRSMTARPQELNQWLGKEAGASGS